MDSITEGTQERIEIVEHPTFEPWVVDLPRLVATLPRNRTKPLDEWWNSRYEVDLERCTTAGEIADWLYQISEKNWGTPEVLGGLTKVITATVTRSVCYGPVKVTHKMVRGHLVSYLTSHTFEEGLTGLLAFSLDEFEKRIAPIRAEWDRRLWVPAKDR